MQVSLNLIFNFSQLQTRRFTIWLHNYLKLNCNFNKKQVFRFQILLLFFFSLSIISYSQVGKTNIDSFRIHNDIKVSVDQPNKFKETKETIIVFYALPNGNTTEQTMGKRMNPEDDWHFDIQHIRAQTGFIRKQLKDKNFVVVYLENDFKSWPAWKSKHLDFRILIPHLVDSLAGIINGKRKSIYLNGHSGGGSFIFGYLAGINQIPKSIKRISFLDSDYGYDSSYYGKFYKWLSQTKGAALNVFAYNDSVALYNGKPFVSATGGTWYRSHLFLTHLQKDFSFSKSKTDSLIIYKNEDKRIQFYFKLNLNRGIYHTQQVELNGFIHSVLCGTKFDSKEYNYYGTRIYNEYIE